MLFIIYTTGRCNLNCSYCGGSFDPRIVPWNVEYTLDDLKNVVGRDDVIAFYGGEPLLNLKFIEEVMDNLSASRWVIQTNGLLLHTMDKSYLHRIDTILVSLDGRSRLTDKNRGRGVYEKVIENIKKIRREGYRGDIVARMTITEDSDIYQDVKHLLLTDLFNHIHWQLSFIWTRPWRNLWGWIEEYKIGLARLMNEWINRLREGFVDGIAPFQGVLKRIIEDGPFPPCGSGAGSFTILTDGRVVSCPIAVSEEWSQIGSLKKISREELESRRNVIHEPCISCSYLKICGVRCLYTHIERLWGEEGVEAVCSCSKYLIDLVKENLEEIKSAVSEIGLELRDLAYPEYNNTVEIMP
ncbi:MAG: TIGR04084 family radical SAM/SPASM domain-containing protein [Nitrososphaeria archaeon]|nr:TIGR04084 family radical SAM/SPASM domain-containing protein [Nitrososphaeria archaeon]